MATKKIIYFTAGIVPTADEATAIGVLNNMTVEGYEVAVRNSAQDGGGSLETADYVAGTIPSGYSEYDEYGDVDTDRPVAFVAFPATVSLAAEATKQISAISSTGTDISGITLTDVTVSADYESDDETKATVSAAGVITAVAEGSATITVSYEYATGLTLTSDVTVTVTA